MASIITGILLVPLLPVLVALPSHTQLAVANRKFSGLLESAPEVMVIVDDGGKILLLNSQTDKRFGYECQELLGRPLEALVPNRFRDTHVSHRQAYFADPHFRAMGKGLELYGRRKDGRELPIRMFPGFKSRCVTPAA